MRRKIISKIDFIREQFEESVQIKKKIAEEYPETILKIAQIMIQTLRRGGKILLCGNGGSAADAQHIACELVVKFGKERKAVSAIALNTNTSVITAAANDRGFETVFARQVEALGKKGDLLIAISTSGKSLNLLEAVKQAQRMGLKTVALSGGNGGPLAKLCTFSLIIPSDHVPRIQEAHITVGHILCGIIEEAFA